MRSLIGGTRMLSWWQAASAFAIAAISLTALYDWSYGDCTGFFFHLDDFWQIKEVSTIHIDSPLDLIQFLRPKPFFLLYRPVTLMYFYGLRQLFGTDPTLYHATQIAFHIMNALLVYAIASRLLASYVLGLAAALVYASAPGHAIAVCWISAFTMTGTAFFFFLALSAWLYLEGRWRVPVTLLVFAIALLASEHAMSFPIVLTLASLLLAPHHDWRRIAREQVGFYVIALVYLGAKLYYIRYIIPNTLGGYPPAYAIELDPQSLLSHIGLYLRYGMAALYTVDSEQGPLFPAGIVTTGIAIGGSLCVIFGKWGARSLRVATFGLDLFIATLGPVIVLQAHQQSYYVGISALGLALFLIGLAAAVPRLSLIAPCAVAGTLVLVHVLSTASVLRESLEFRIFNGGSEIAAGWLYTLASVIEPSVREVVVPSDPLIDRLVASDAHKLFLCARYRLLASPDIASEPSAKDRVVLATWTAPPQQAGHNRPWAWLEQPCAQKQAELAQPRLTETSEGQR